MDLGVQQCTKCITPTWYGCVQKAKLVLQALPLLCPVECTLIVMYVCAYIQSGVYR